MNWLLATVGTSSQDDSGWLLHQYGRFRTLVDTVALTLFGWLVSGRSPRRDRQQTLAATHAADPYEIVEARTLLYAVVSGMLAGCCGVVAIPSALRLLERSLLRATAQTPILSISTEFGTSAIVAGTAAGTVVIAAGTAIAVHESRWWWLEQRATARERRIDATLPRAVAFMYALSRSGMSLPRILRALADNEAVYGEAAAEFGVAVREIDVFGTDVITALEATGQRTPSDELAELATNLASVLDSNQRLAAYLADHHERSRAAATATHEQSLDRLSAAAEGYVTVLVVGPLFLLTTLTILGLVVADTTVALRGIVYVAVPLGTAGFLLAIDRIEYTRESPDGGSPAVSEQSCISTPPDDSVDRWATQRATLRLYDTVGRGHRWLRHPKATLLANPWLTGVVTLPIGLVWVIATTRSQSLAVPAGLASLAGPISQAAVIVCAGYAIVYEAEQYRRRRIEAAVPDFLDRLGGLTEAGLSVADAVHRVSDADLGALRSPLERTWRDVEWGADIETALHRLATRVRSPRVRRAVTLVTNASRATSDIAPVLSIAAAEVRTRRRLDRERTRLLALYLLVIYVAFLVFLGIVAALSATFLPAISTAAVAPPAAAAAGSLPAAGSASAVGTATHLSPQDVTIYRSLFFHAAVVQAVCSGLAAGKLAAGTLRGGVKHVAVLLSMAHIAFWLI